MYNLPGIEVWIGGEISFRRESEIKANVLDILFSAASARKFAASARKFATSARKFAASVAAWVRSFSPAKAILSGRILSRILSHYQE